MTHIPDCSPAGSKAAPCVVAHRDALCQQAGTGNATPWRHIAEFLEDQQLATLGLRMVRRPACCAWGGPACGVGPGAALLTIPVGNHGENNNLPTGRE